MLKNGCIESSFQFSICNRDNEKYKKNKKIERKENLLLMEMELKIERKRMEEQRGKLRWLVNKGHSGCNRDTRDKNKKGKISSNGENLP